MYAFLMESNYHIARGKKPQKERGDDADGGSVVIVSTSDPESGLFRKGDHKTELVLGKPEKLTGDLSGWW